VRSLRDEIRFAGEIGLDGRWVDLISPERETLDFT
jgi:hypothetical protein